VDTQHSFPLHPATVHFPIALWLWGTFSDACFWATSDLFWQRSGALALVAGAIFGLITLTAGMVDFIRFPNAGRAAAEAYLHMAIMTTVWMGFVTVQFLRSKAALPDRRHMACTCAELLLFALGTAGAHFGGRLSFKYGFGVDKTARAIDNKTERI
jgi:uncharacterized membrane protein